jgi:hypothetical protein
MLLVFQPPSYAFCTPLISKQCKRITQARRRRKEALLKGLQEAYERLQLYAHGISALCLSEATAQILHRHLLRGPGTQAVDILLLYQDVRHCNLGAFTHSFGLKMPFLHMTYRDPGN